jgi:Cu/Ag efflux protein CusF
MMSQFVKLFAISLIISMFLSTAWAADQHSVKGVVNAVKLTAGKLTISHGPITGLGMGAMTMDFKVYDPAMLDEVSKGHEIAFVLEQDKAGSLVIMEIEDLGMSKNAPASDGHSHQH